MHAQYQLESSQLEVLQLVERIECPATCFETNLPPLMESTSASTSIRSRYFSLPPTTLNLQFTVVVPVFLYALANRHNLLEIGSKVVNHSLSF